MKQDNQNCLSRRDQSNASLTAFGENTRARWIYEGIFCGSLESDRK